MSWNDILDVPLYSEEWDKARLEELIKKETGHIGLVSMWTSYRYILDLVIPDDDSSIINNTKLYPYYLYAIIKGGQNQCLEFNNQINGSEVLKWLKNTRPDWQEELDWLKNETKNCFIRYLIYESIFKSIFDIPINEQNINSINNKIPIYSKLSENQLKSLKEFILDPIIYGIFNDIFNDKYDVLNCTSGICNVEVAEKFPYPISDDSPKPPFKTLPDLLRIAAIYNNISFKKKLAYELIFTSTTIFDSIMSGLTGVEKGWTLQLGTKVENTSNKITTTISDINKEIKKTYKNLKNSLPDLNPSNITEQLKPIMILGSLGLGLFIATKFFPE